MLFDCPSPVATAGASGQEGDVDAAAPPQQPSHSPLTARMVHDMNEADVAESDEHHCTNVMDAACPSGSSFVHLYERYIAMAEDVCW